MMLEWIHVSERSNAVISKPNKCLLLVREQIDRSRIQSINTSSLPSSYEPSAMEEPMPVLYSYNRAFYKAGMPSKWHLPFWLHSQEIYFLWDDVGLKSALMDWWPGALTHSFANEISKQQSHETHRSRPLSATRSRKL